jgi:hypothetical protein
MSDKTTHWEQGNGEREEDIARETEPTNGRQPEDQERTAGRPETRMDLKINNTNRKAY